MKRARATMTADQATITAADRAFILVLVAEDFTITITITVIMAATTEAIMAAITATTNAFDE